jgi:hypothetical protein
LGGEIFVLNSADYGPVTINKAVSITSEGAAARILATSGAAITMSPGASDFVKLRGLTIDGANSGAVGIPFVPTHLRENGVRMKNSIVAIALTTPFIVSAFPADSLAADAKFPVAQRATRHYRVVEESGWRRCPPRCPDRYSCAPPYGAYGPWGGESYWATYSYAWSPYFYTK